MTTPNSETLTHRGYGAQIRRSPFFDATLRHGCRGFSVYNHMYIPRDFGDPVRNYWNLVERVILCDVSVERQVEITGPDAYRFIRTLTPRNLEKWPINRCRYALITDQYGGIVNDPVCLRLDENHFWISIADSDVALWAKGVAVHSGMKVHIREPDVSPVQLQGPRSVPVMQALVGNRLDGLRYYELAHAQIDGVDVVISRTGWSSEKGYEIYLMDSTKGTRLWDAIMEAGKPFDIAPGHTSMIRRIEGGMLSYHADMTIDNNPFEVNLDRLVDLEQETAFVGKESLREIKEQGIRQRLVGLEIEGPPFVGPNDARWLVRSGESAVGYVTSGVYSPRLDKNIALAMLGVEHAALGSRVSVATEQGEMPAEVVRYPFIDPDKQIPKAS